VDSLLDEPPARAWPIAPRRGPGYSYDSSGNVQITDSTHELTQNVQNFPVQAYCDIPATASRTAPPRSPTPPAASHAWRAGNYGAGRTVYIGPIAFGDFQNYAGAKNYFSDSSFQNLLLNALTYTAGKRALNLSVDISTTATSN